MNRTKDKALRIFTLWLPLALFMLVILFPFYWIICTSFKVPAEIMTADVSYWPREFSMANYLKVWTNMNFAQYFTNSLITSCSTVMIVMVTSMLGGYALSKFRFAGKKLVLVLLLMTQMIPAVILVIPLFRNYMTYKLNNTLLSLILTYSTTQLPFCMLMMNGTFSGIPKSLEEAARVDGCSLMGAIFRVILPAAAPGIVAAGCFAFVGSWNDFVYALNFLNDRSKFTLTIGLNMMQGEFAVEYGALCAGCVIALIPVMIIFSYVQKYLVQGLTADAVKG